MEFLTIIDNFVLQMKYNQRIHGIQSKWYEYISGLTVVKISVRFFKQAWELFWIVALVLEIGNLTRTLKNIILVT